MDHFPNDQNNKNNGETMTSLRKEGANDNTTDDRGDDDNDGVPVPVGAFRVRGPSGRGGVSDDDEMDASLYSVSTATRSDDQGRDVAEDGPNQSLARGETIVEAYAVEENNGDTITDTADDEERGRNALKEYLSRAPRAEVLDLSKRNKIIILAIVLLTAIVITAVSVPLARSSKGGTTTTPDNDNIMASYDCEDLMVMHAEIRQTGGVYANSTTSSGSMSSISCKVKPCLNLVGSDDGKFGCKSDTRFDPSKPCCVGPEEEGCTEEERCGLLCFFDEVCTPIDPLDENCFSKDCARCETDYKGEDPYVIDELLLEFDCVHAGRGIRESNGEPYNWMIMCGPVSVPPSGRLYWDIGDWVCTAVRSGAGFSDEDEGIFTPFVPCHLLQQAFCGCQDPSVEPTDWLPAPTFQCLTPEDGCPFLCGDAGPSYVRDLCHAFPGDMAWWDGTNFLNMSMWRPGIVVRELQRGCEVKLEDGFFG